MKSDNALDSVEFRISASRTRCEIYIAAEGISEKLASGFLKPFVTNLRAVEVQIRRGLQIVRLERPPGSTEHNDRIWFTKGTLERFVRFVSTPEVLEKVKTLDEELNQLEQVWKFEQRSLAKIKDQNGGSGSVVYTLGARNTKEDTLMSKLSFETIESRTEASKRVLLKAMEARLAAMHQEQNVAFAHASATGFDVDSIVDLMAFADFFGADRLRDACSQFLELYKRRQVNKVENIEPCSIVTEPKSSVSDLSIPTMASNVGSDIDCEHEISSHETSAHIPRRGNLTSEMGSSTMDSGYKDQETSRKWKAPGTEPVSGAVLKTCPLRTSSHRRASSVDAKLERMEASVAAENKSMRETAKETLSRQYHPGELNLKQGMFLSNLKKMAKQLEARRPEHSIVSMFDEAQDRAWQSILRQPSFGSQSPTKNSERSAKEVLSGTYLDSISLPPLEAEDRSSASSSGGSAAMPSNGISSHQDAQKTEEVHSSNGDVEASATSAASRFSVQAAISLFETRRKESNVSEVPVKKPGRQDSGKSFLRRGSGAHELNLDVNGEHAKSENKEITKAFEPPDININREKNSSLGEETLQEFTGMSEKTTLPDSSASQVKKLHPDMHKERKQRLRNQAVQRAANHREKGKESGYDEVDINRNEVNDCNEEEKVEALDIRSVKIADSVEAERGNASESLIRRRMKAPDAVVKPNSVGTGEEEKRRVSRVIVNEMVEATASDAHRSHCILHSDMEMNQASRNQTANLMASVEDGEMDGSIRVQYEKNRASETKATVSGACCEEKRRKKFSPDNIVLETNLSYSEMEIDNVEEMEKTDRVQNVKNTASEIRSAESGACSEEKISKKISGKNNFLIRNSSLSEMETDQVSGNIMAKINVHEETVKSGGILKVQNAKMRASEIRSTEIGAHSEEKRSKNPSASNILLKDNSSFSEMETNQVSGSKTDRLNAPVEDMDKRDGITGVQQKKDKATDTRTTESGTYIEEKKSKKSAANIILLKEISSYSEKETDQASGNKTAEFNIHAEEIEKSDGLIRVQNARNRASEVWATDSGVHSEAKVRKKSLPDNMLLKKISSFSEMEMDQSSGNKTANLRVPVEEIDKSDGVIRVHQEQDKATEIRPTESGTYNEEKRSTQSSASDILLKKKSSYSEMETGQVSGIKIAKFNTHAEKIEKIERIIRAQQEKDKASEIRSTESGTYREEKRSAKSSTNNILLKKNSSYSEMETDQTSENKAAKFNDHVEEIDQNSKIIRVQQEQDNATEIRSNKSGVYSEEKRSTKSLASNFLLKKHSLYSEIETDQVSGNQTAKSNTHVEKIEKIERIIREQQEKDKVAEIRSTESGTYREEKRSAKSSAYNMLLKKNSSYSEMGTEQISGNKTAKFNAYVEENNNNDKDIGTQVTDKATELRSTESGAYSDEKRRQNQEVRKEQDMDQSSASSDWRSSESASSSAVSGFATASSESLPNCDEQPSPNSSGVGNGNQSTADSSSVNMQNADWRKEFKLKLERTLSRDPRLGMDKKPELNVVKLAKSNSVDSNGGVKSLMRASLEMLSTVASQARREDDAGKPRMELPLQGQAPVVLKGTAPPPKPPPMPPPMPTKILPRMSNAKPASNSSYGHSVSDPNLTSLSNGIHEHAALEAERPRAEMRVSGVKNVLMKAGCVITETVDKSSSQTQTEWVSVGESLDSSSNTYPDMHILTDMAGHQKLEAEDEEPYGGGCGRLYEQYRKLRDAKLRTEQAAKRAEREATIKAMEETLVKRKAEMQARSVRSLRRPSLPVESYDENSNKHKSTILKEQEQEEVKGDEESMPELVDALKSGSTSPASVAHFSMERQAGMKARSNRKASLHSSHRMTQGSTTQVVKHISKSQQKPPATSSQPIADNRRDQSRVLCGRNVGTISSSSKSVSTRSRNPGCEVASMEANGNGRGPPQPFSSNSRERRVPGLRKSCSTVAELKGLASEEEESSRPKVRVDESGKIRRAALTHLQDTKSFLRKGGGKRPGAVPSATKHRSSFGLADTAKNSDEIALTTSVEHNDRKKDVPSGRMPDPVSVLRVDDSEHGAGSEDDASLNWVVCPEPEDHEDFNESEVSYMSNGSRDFSSVDQENAPTYRTEGSFSTVPSFLPSSTYRDHTAILSPPMAASPPDFALKPAVFPAYANPPCIVLDSSALQSPASWNSTQPTYASQVVEAPRSRKKWGIPVIPLADSCVDNPKGSISLFKFRRKSQSSETVASDCISSSASSHGDGDCEEETKSHGSQSIDGFRKESVRDSTLNPGLDTAGDSAEMQGEGGRPSSHAPIPAEHVDVKLQEDHISGGTLLKGALND